MSVIEETAVLTTTAASSASSVTGTDSAVISDEFRELLTELSERRNAMNNVKETNTGSSIFNQMNSDLLEITENLQGFFDPDSNLYTLLHKATRMFSSITSARSELLSTLKDISVSNPVTAAGMVKDMLALQSTFSKAMDSRGSNSVRFVYAKVAFIKMSFQTQMNNFFSGSSGGTMGGGINLSATNGSGNFSTATRFSQLTLQMTMQEVAASAGSAATTRNANSSAFDFSLLVQGAYTQTDLYMSILDPIVLDINGDGIDLRPIDDGVLFDLAGDGKEVKCGFVQGDDALLFFDANGDGVCTDGLELFGDQEGDANGFAELGKYDSNGDSEISAADNIFDKLQVWNDWNGDGKSSKEEIRSLKQAGVEAIALQYINSNATSGGNGIGQSSFFRTLQGELRAAVDANFNYYTRS